MFTLTFAGDEAGDVSFAFDKCATQEKEALRAHPNADTTELECEADSWCINCVG